MAVHKLGKKVLIYSIELVYIIGQAIVYYNEGTRPFKGRCLRRAVANTNEQRSRSGLCERVIHREATETEGLVYLYY